MPLLMLQHLLFLLLETLLPCLLILRGVLFRFQIPEASYYCLLTRTSLGAQAQGWAEVGVIYTLNIPILPRLCFIVLVEWKRSGASTSCISGTPFLLFYEWSCMVGSQDLVDQTLLHSFLATLSTTKYIFPPIYKTNFYNCWQKNKWSAVLNLNHLKQLK